MKLFKFTPEPGTTDRPPAPPTTSILGGVIKIKSDVMGALPLGARGYAPEKWINLAQAEAEVQKAMTEKNFLGQLKYSSREEAEKAVLGKLRAKSTGIMAGDDDPLKIARAVALTQAISKS